jgi:hypothetical protein
MIMKKNVVLTAMLAICLCHLQAQPEDRITTTLASQFAADFPKATNARWTKSSGVTLASFLSDGEVFIAYYDASEQHIATARKVAEPDKLPLLVRQALDESCKKLGEKTQMGPIFELVIGSSTRYIVSVEGQEKTCTFRFDTMGNRAIVDKRPTTRHGATTPTPYLARDPRL